MRYVIFENSIMLVRDEAVNNLPVGAKLVPPEFETFCKTKPYPTTQEIIAAFDALPVLNIS